MRLSRRRRSTGCREAAARELRCGHLPVEPVHERPRDERTPGERGRTPRPFAGAGTASIDDWPWTNADLAAELDALRWAFLILDLLLAGVHLYPGLLAPFVDGVRAIPFVVIGVLLLLGPVVFLTPYWRPLFYLLGAAFAMHLGALWVLGGMEYFRIGSFAGITATGFVLLGFCLCLRERSPLVRSEQRGSHGTGTRGSQSSRNGFEWTAPTNLSTARSSSSEPLSVFLGPWPPSTSVRWTSRARISASVGFFGVARFIRMRFANPHHRYW